MHTGPSTHAPAYRSDSNPATAAACDGPGVRPRRPGARVREAAAAGGIVLLGTLLFSASDRLLIGSFNDDGVYVALGRALAEGQGYRSIHTPGDPVHAKYPPGLPAVLAVLWWVGGSLPAVALLAHAVNLAVVGAAAGLAWWYGRTALELRPLPLALLGLGPFFLDASLEYNGLVLSEPYFVLGWAAALVVCARLPRGGAGEPRTRSAALLGLMLAATTLFRSQGLVLVASVLSVLAAQRIGRRAWSVCAASSLAPPLAWTALHRWWLARGPVSAVPDELSYRDWLGAQGARSPVEDALGVVASNAAGYLRVFGGYASGIRAVGIAAVCAFAALVVAGVWRSRHRHAVLPATVLATAGVVLLWPFEQDRLMLSAMPFMGLLAAGSVDAGLRALPAWGRWTGRVALLAIAGALAVRQANVRSDALRRVENGQPPGIFTPSYVLALNSLYIERVSAWLLEHAAPDDRVLVELPAGVYLHTGLKAVGSMVAHAGRASPAFASPGDFLARRILGEDVTIVVLGNLAAPIARDIAAVMERCPGVIVPAGEGRGAPVPAYFRVNRDDRCLRERILGRDDPGVPQAGPRLPPRPD